MLRTRLLIAAGGRRDAQADEDVKAGWIAFAIFIC